MCNLPKQYVTIRIESDILNEIRRIQGFYLLKEGKRYSISDVIGKLIKETRIEIAGVPIKKSIHNSG